MGTSKLYMPDCGKIALIYIMNETTVRCSATMELNAGIFPQLFKHPTVFSILWMVLYNVQIPLRKNLKHAKTMNQSCIS